jgi:hypothetical protein
MSSPKIHPEPLAKPGENDFFIIPGVPIWKQQELARDPSFRDLNEQIQDAQMKGSNSTWSAKRGYELTFRQEAALMKANTRAANIEEKKQKERTIEMVQKLQITDQHDSCCTIM